VQCYAQAADSLLLTRSAS